ncbi:M23 family metallopeptidase [Ilumatobacter coccineus]|uniref:Putative metalloendopeptidase n=1 Tax=Ilumatobacter coccineus (strain NBRC 103263 / KCTC 29153 / YM16-304) TaxID=1313172 RepID=A0A6C7EFC8_ILUCY|nr:M23 family metallopeptidase [Ilumatobacter coccineus]BAN03735.1 putative metalloendopeptidase [Ilumatobacter coccineus YM16-304]
MFRPDATSTRAERRAIPRRRRTRVVAKHLKVGIAVAAAVVSVPFGARAEPRPLHTDIVTQFATDDVAGSSARPDDELLLDACPIDGSSTFEDSWGWARSGGRSHEGVDLIASRGTPIIAVRDGWANFTTSNLGGRAVWLTADNGDKFYYAHLDDWEGESRTVAAGDVIGYVGSTGNAQGPHLHFETMPDGVVENPFPHTLGACVPAPPPVVNEIAQMHASNRLGTQL